MPTFVFTCERCGARRPFLVHDTEAKSVDGSHPLERHCPTCRTMTYWKPQHQERRAGQDRRSGLDRRES